MTATETTALIVAVVALLCAITAYLNWRRTRHAAQQRARDAEAAAGQEAARVGGKHAPATSDANQETVLRE